MKIKIIILFSLLVNSLIAQDLWKSVSADHQIPGYNQKQRGISPNQYASYHLEYESLKQILRHAPKESDPARIQKSVAIELPMPNGKLEVFKFYETSNFHPDLAAQFPDIQSFVGISTIDPYKTARVDFGHRGFHGSIRTMDGPIYIDPYFHDDFEFYNSYYIKDDYVDPAAPRGCGYDDYVAYANGENIQQNNNVEYTGMRAGEPVKLKKFRLALACTGEWGGNPQFGNGTVENVAANFNTSVNRLNQMFINELGMKVELISNNILLIFLDAATDPYNLINPGHQGRELLGLNTAVINNAVGADSYDFGHVFTRWCTDDIGGVAFGGSACGANKGAGVSCVGGAGINSFMVNTTAHEIGHQLSAGHSWASCEGAQENVASGTAYEPGSGTTILSYAGGCGPDNLSSTNDDYYHVASLVEMNNFLKNTGECYEEITTSNTAPMINWKYDNNFSIPISTPFELETEATDVDDDVLTYCWEQYNLGPTRSLGEVAGNGPSFRSFYPTQENHRTFPSIVRVLNLQNVDEEILPTYSRDLTFRCTVRDNDQEAGATVWEEVKFKASDQAGPFVVTSPSSVLNLEVGKELMVEWDIANTDKAPINCEFVDIYISTDAGYTYPYLAASNTPNDGAATILMPNDVSNQVRVKVKAADNIFFNLSFPNFRIIEPSEPGFYFDLGQVPSVICLPDVLEIPLDGTAFQGFEEDISFSVISGLPEGAVVDFGSETISPTGSTTITIDLGNVTSTGIYEVNIQGVASNADTITRVLVLNTVYNDFSDLAIMSPAAGQSGLPGLPTFTWTDAANAESYTFELSASPSFTDNIVTLENYTETSYVLDAAVLDKSRIYYWRVSGSNRCTAAVTTPISVFGTEALSCKNYISGDLPKTISQNSTPTIESRINIDGSGQVLDVNIIEFKGTHSRMRDLRATLISPSGTEVLLFEYECGNLSDFDCGFDDESPFGISCPLKNKKFKPTESLSAFNGENISGTWIMEIQDITVGAGGQFQNFDIQMCSNATLDNPFIVNNEILKTPPGAGAYITQIDLLAEDSNNTADELVFTLVDLPKFGEVRFDNGAAMPAGSKWTQQDINSNRVKYVHNGSGEMEDQFSFTVIDGVGGWINKTLFNIEVDEGAASGVEDINKVSSFHIFPNPASDILVIKNESPIQSLEWQGTIYDVNGRILKTFSVQSGDQKMISIKDLTEGLYLVRMQHQDQIDVHNISVIR